jgi:hypothetical protein
MCNFSQDIYVTSNSEKLPLDTFPRKSKNAKVQRTEKLPPSAYENFGVDGGYKPG